MPGASERLADPALGPVPGADGQRGEMGRDDQVKIKRHRDVPRHDPPRMAGQHIDLKFIEDAARRNALIRLTRLSRRIWVAARPGFPADVR